MEKRNLILADGTVFRGTAFGSSHINTGEVIFNPAMTGYQEIISDPDYYGKITVMTYPTIGAYGINRDDFESIIPTISGMIVKEISNQPSNFRKEATLDEFLKIHDIPGVANIDTRMLTNKLREKGTMRGIIVDESMSVEDALNTLQNQSNQTDIVNHISIKKPYIVPGQGKRIVIIDLGMKHQVLQEFTDRKCHVTVVPYNYSPENIVRFKPNGILISNGPGNPKHIPETVKTVYTLLGKVPIFAIGLGHQVLALACGAETSRLKVGKFSPNYAIKDIQNDKSWLATVSHHYIVEEKSIENLDLNITYRSLNEHFIEGISHKKHPAFSVQFNPEGAPGSTETNFLFDKFLHMMDNFSAKTGGK